MLQTLLALSIVLSAPPAATGAATDEGLVRKAFEDYRAAVLARNGVEAAGSLDEESVHYYARTRDSALNDDAETLKQEPFFFRMTVLRLRKELGAEQFKKMNGRDVVARAIESGWISASSVENARLGKVSVQGAQATGEAFMGEQKAPFEFGFKRDAQGWRFSLLPIFAFTEPTMKDLAKRAGKTEDALILAMLEQVTGQALTEDIWKPLVSSSAEGDTVPASAVVSAPEAAAAESSATLSARPHSRVLGALGGKAFIFKRTDGKARTFTAVTSCPDVARDDEVVFLEGGPDVECEKAAFENRRTKSVCKLLCRKLTP